MKPGQNSSLCLHNFVCACVPSKAGPSNGPVAMTANQQLRFGLTPRD